MRILYRYIFRRAFAASFFVAATCSVIASLINLFDILDEVVKQNVLMELLFRYLWISMIPRMMDLMNVMMVLAGLFTMGELSRRLELAAMRAAGLGDGVLMKPVIGLACLLFATVLYGGLECVPGLQRLGDELKTQMKSGRVGEPVSMPFYVQLGNVSLQADGVEPNLESPEMKDVRISVMESGRVSEVYQSQKVVKRSGEWKLVEGVHRILDPTTGQVMKYAAFREIPYPPHFPPPSDFLYEAAHRRDLVQWMTFTNLMAERSFTARQEIHKRLALALSTAISLLVGAAFGMKMHRFNAARAICLAILIGFAHRLIFDGFLAVGVEIGASWMCHMSNLFLAAAVGFIPFLTSE